MSSKILKSAFIVSSMTLISRISGLLRDIVFANYLGGGAEADAFFVAFRIPNLFRRIFAEGAFSLAFVPVFSEYHHSRTAQETQAFANNMAAKLGLALLAFTLFGMLTAPWLVSVIALGYETGSPKYEMAVAALRICFPYLFFISLVAMAAGIMNTYERFAVPAITPVFLNICLIIAAVVFVPDSAYPTVVLAIGVFIAGLVQFLFQIPFLNKHAILPKPMQAKSDSSGGAKRVFKLMLPSIFGSSVAQINMIINTMLASFLVTGSISWLYYADRLMEFPLGLFAIAISSVILPSLSKQHAIDDKQAFSDLLDWGLRVALLVVIPSAMGIFALSGPLLTTLFQYNQFSEHDVLMSSMSLQAFCVGMLGFVVVKVLAPSFYARQDPKTPVKIAVVAMLVNVAAGVLLVGPFKHVGLAMALSISAWVNATLLWAILRRSGQYKPATGWLSYIARLLIAATCMAGLVNYLAGDIEQWFAYSFYQRVSYLGLWIIVGMTTFVVLSYAMGLRIKKLLGHKSVINEKHGH